jgi:GTP-binding protein EngB required for normal cell division
MTIVDQDVQHLSMEAALHELLMIEGSGSGNTCLRERLHALEQKLLSNQLHLAVLGQMKRGKSSLINALLGAEILPTGVLPVTSVITEIRYGPAPDAAVSYSTGLREKINLNTLADYITESGNPGNSKQVASVEIAYPSPLLETGIILIDTPGIGSTKAHNTRTTESYVQHVDAGIVVLSVDPPITEVESRFIQNISEDIPKLFFILNKTDVASADEACRIAHFLEDELNRLRIESPEIFSLSARRALQGAAGANGIESFERRLRTFLQKEKGQVLLRSVALDALQIARALKFAAAMGARAQALSPLELDLKRMALDRLLEQTGVEVHELQVLLHQHSADLVARVETDLSAQVESSVPAVRQHLKSFHSLHPMETGRAFGALIENFLMQEVEMVFRAWRAREDEEIQTQLDALSRRFVAQANVILERFQQSAGCLFEIPVEQVAIACPLCVESHLHYQVERVFYSLDTFLLVLPRFLLRPLVLRRLSGRIGRLLDWNAGRIRFDYLERLQSSIREFENALTVAIAMVTDSLRCALHQRGSGTQRETEALDSVIKDCIQLSL